MCRNLCEYYFYCKLLKSDFTFPHNNGYYYILLVFNCFVFHYSYFFELFNLLLCLIGIKQNRLNI